MPENKPLIILGIDPGTVAMGYAVIRCEGQKISLEAMDALRMSYTHDVFERLHRIYLTIDEVIATYKPGEFAIEAPFFGKNVQSMLKLGRAQGVAIACAIKNGLQVTEYSPKKVKQAITGNGNADKEQVWGMLKRLTGLTEQQGGLDASDALGVAVCHFYQTHSAIGKLGSTSKAKGWDDFIKKNPGRLAGK
jgi:crossover junction endodeoxyribonuclease RuvC